MSANGICPNADSIVINGKRWFDKINGNTYHSVEVYADGKLVGSNPFEYGYDEGFIHTAFVLLQEAGICKKYDERFKSGVAKDWYDFQNDRRNNREKYLTFVSDVGRKRDLAVQECNYVKSNPKWKWEKK